MRRSASRYGTARRGNSLKPVGLPMAWDSMNAGLDFFVVLGTLGEDAFVIGGHDFDELGRDFRPLGEDFFSERRIRELPMQLNQIQQLGAVVGRRDLL